MNTINFMVTKPVPDKPGYVTIDRMVTYDELEKALVEYLKGIEFDFPDGEKGTLYDAFDYVSCGSMADDKTKPIPDCFRIISYVVQGNCEGYYFHIDALIQDRQNHNIIAQNIALAKTFYGTHNDMIFKMQTHFAKAVIHWDW